MRADARAAADAGRVAVYLSDGETWDSVEGCRVVFYADEEWTDGPTGFHEVSVETLVACYLKGDEG